MDDDDLTIDNFVDNDAWDWFNQTGMDQDIQDELFGVDHFGEDTL